MQYKGYQVNRSAIIVNKVILRNFSLNKGQCIKIHFLSETSGCTYFYQTIYTIILMYIHAVAVQQIDQVSQRHYGSENRHI